MPREGLPASPNREGWLGTLRTTVRIPHHLTHLTCCNIPRFGLKIRRPLRSRGFDPASATNGLRILFTVIYSGHLPCGYREFRRTQDHFLCDEENPEGRCGLVRVRFPLRFLLEIQIGVAIPARGEVMCGYSRIAVLPLEPLICS
jgi:hypothetical protein